MRTTLLLFLSLLTAPLYVAAAEAASHTPNTLRVESTDSKSSSLKSTSLNCEAGDASIQKLKTDHPLVLTKDHERKEKRWVAAGMGTASYTVDIKEKHNELQADFDAHAAVWLAHALACPFVKKEEIIKYLDEEVPSQLTTMQSFDSVLVKGKYFWNNKTENKWVTHPLRRNFDNAETFLKPKETATTYKMILEKLSFEKELSDAFSQQLLEYAQARFEKRDPRGVDSLKKLIVEIGKKIKSGRLNEVTKGEEFIIGFLTQGRPSVSERIFGSYLTAMYRGLLLDGEPKVAKNGSGTFSTDPASPKYILSGQNIVPPSLQNAFVKLAEHNERNNPEDKSLFWKDPKNTVLIELNQLGEPNRSNLRKWARERIFAIQEGSVEGGDPLTQEALDHVLSALEGNYNKSDRHVDLPEFGDLHTVVTGQREKIASHPESWNLTALVDSLADRLKKTHGLDLTEEARRNFLDLGNAERRVLLELADKSGDKNKKTLQQLLKNLHTDTVIEVVHNDSTASSIYYDQLKKDLNLPTELKTKVDELVKALNKANPNENAATIKKASAIRNELITQLKNAASEGKKGQAEAEALSRLINISDEVGLSKEQRSPLGENRHSVPITIHKLEAEKEALRVVNEELDRSGRSGQEELDKLISELYPKGMNIPSNTRVILAKLLLPEHAPHIGMLKRLKNISELRDGLMSDPRFRQVGKDFRTLLLEPTPQNIEAMLAQFSPEAHALFVHTQGDKNRQMLLRKLMLEPEAFATILRKMAEGKELDKALNGQADLAQALAQLGATELLRNVGMLDSIVGMETIDSLPKNIGLAQRLLGAEKLEEILKSKDAEKKIESIINSALGLQINAIVGSLINDGSRAVLRGEGIPEVANMSEAKRGALAIAIRKMAGDLPADVNSQDILASLNVHNQVGLKVRADLEKLLVKTSSIPSVDATIDDSLNNLLDRQLRRLNLDFSQKNRDYEEAYRSYESFRTEHRRYGKSEWDKKVMAGLSNWSAKSDDEKSKASHYWMGNFESYLKGRKSDMAWKEKAAVEQKALIEMVAGRTEPDGSVTNLNMLKVKLEQLRAAYLADLEAKHTELSEAEFKQHEAELRKDMLEKYLASITLPKELQASDLDEVRTQANNFLSTSWKQHSHLSREQDSRSKRISDFVEQNYGAEIEKHKDPKIQESVWESYYNMVDKMLGEAAASKAKVKLLAEAAHDKFDTVSTTMVGNDPKRRQAFEDLAKTVGPEAGHNPEKLSRMATQFVDEHIKSDLDKIADPNERAQQRENIIARLSEKLQNKYTYGSTARTGQNWKNWKGDYFQSLVDQYASDVVLGKDAGFKLSHDEVNKQMIEAMNKAFTEQRKSDFATVKAMGKLQALGITFDGSSVVLDSKSRTFLAHNPAELIYKDLHDSMVKSGWKSCDIMDFGGDPEMVEACREKTWKGISPLPTGKGGDKQMLDALKVVNESGIPLKIDHLGYSTISLDGKRAMQDFMVTLFNQVNQGNQSYMLPLGEHDAVRITVDPDSGKMSYELQSKSRLSKALRSCMHEIEQRRDIHHLSTEDYAAFSAAFMTVMSGGREQWQSKQMTQAWNEYVKAVNDCSNFGAIDNGKGVTGESFIEDERTEKMNHQLALQKYANQKFEGNVNLIQDVAIQAAIFAGTLGASSALQAVAVSTRVALAAETIANLSFAQKMIFLAARSNKARTALNFGTTLLESTMPTVQAATKAYGKKYLEGAAWGAAPLPVVYGAQNISQWNALSKAEELYRNDKFVAPKSEDFKTADAFKKATKEWEELQARTDRNFNGIPDSLDGMGVSWITPDIADTFNTLAGGGEFFGGMSATHTLFPKVPGISYLSVFAGSMNSNSRDLFHGRKTMGQALADSTASTAGMLPGLLFMNNAQALYRLPGMTTKIGLGMKGPTVGRTLTTAGIYGLNKAGHGAGELLGLTPPTEHAESGEMGLSDKAAWWANEATSLYFAYSMSGVSELRSIARQLGNANKPVMPSSTSTSITVPVPKAGEGKPKTGATAESYQSLVKHYGEKKVKDAITMMSPEELLNTTDPEVFNTAAAQARKSPAQFRETLDIALNGTKANFFKEMGIKGNEAVAGPTKPQSYIEKAAEKLKQAGKIALEVIDGPQGWTHNLDQMDAKYQRTILDTYRSATDSASQQKIAQYMAQKPEFLLGLKASELKFTEDSTNTDRYLLASLAKESAYNKSKNKNDKKIPQDRLNALNSGIEKNGQSLSVYEYGFTEYVRLRVKDGTAQERTLAQLRDNYQSAWDHGEFNDVLNMMLARTARAGALVPVGP